MTNILQPDFLDKVRTILLMKPELELLGMLLYSMNIEIKQFPGTIEEISKEVGGIAYTDGKIITMYAASNLTIKQVIHILIHEMMHILYEHVVRRGSRDGLIWNMAVDHCVERDLKSLHRNNVCEPPYKTAFDEKIHNQYPYAHAEKVYDILIKDQDEYETESISLDSQGSGDSNQSSSSSQESNNQSGESDGGDSSDDSGSNGKHKLYKRTNKKTGETKYFAEDVSMQQDGDEKKKYEKAVQEKIHKARLSWNSSSTNKGNLPSQMVRLLDELLAIKVAWDEILADAIVYHSDDNNRRSYTRPNYYIRNFTVPGRISNDEPRFFVFIIDASGSMSDDELKKALSVCCQSTFYFDELIIVCHDTEMGTVMRFDENPDEEMVFDRVSDGGIDRGGGTSHKEVFKFLDKLREEELISVIVFMTDFYSDVSKELWEDSKWTQEIPSIWLITDEMSKPDYLDGKWINVH